MLPELTNVQKVLVMQVGSRQDLMLTIPALQKLRELVGDATITLMVSPCNSEISIELPWVDEVFVYEGGDTFVDAERELALISKLRQSAFDAAVIFTNPGESPYPLAYICYLAGIPMRIGQSQEFGGGVLSEWVKLSSKDSHPVDKHLFLIECK
jgi:ADP-heptose:LPS heptosyltransferase